MKSSTLLAAAAAMAVTAPAMAQSYTGGSANVTQLGADLSAYPDTTFDNAVFTGLSGTVTGAGNYDLSSVDFQAGINRNDSTEMSGDLTLAGVFGGSNFNYLVHYVIDIASSDTLTLGGNDFHLFGRDWHVNTLTLSSGGEVESGTLSAFIGGAVPEPASWALMLGGFGLIGGMMRSQRKAAVSFA